MSIRQGYGQGTAFLISHEPNSQYGTMKLPLTIFLLVSPRHADRSWKRLLENFTGSLLDYSSFSHFLNGQRLLRSVSSCSRIPSRVARFYHKSSILCHKGRRRKTSIFFGRGKGRSGSQGSTEAERKAYHYHVADRTLSKDIHVRYFGRVARFGKHWKAEKWQELREKPGLKSRRCPRLK